MSDNIELGINENLGTLGADAATDIDNSPTSRPQISSHTSPLEAGFSDGSGALFSIFMKIAEEEDKKMTDNWKGDADGIILFTTLFSVIVAGFLALAYPNLQQSSQDTSAFYLAHLYQVSAANSSIAPVLPLPPNLSDPSTFSASSSAIWVNVLWFMSLIISLTCALLATMLQQWARRYLRVTGKRYSLHKRARIRTFFAEGADKWYLPWVVEALPGLLHASVFLFFAGLPIFLFGTNHTVFTAVLSCVVTSGLAYLLITFMPLVCHDSPYHTPLSTLLWFLDAGIRHHFLWLSELYVFYCLNILVVVSAAAQRPYYPPRPIHRMLRNLSTSVKRQYQRLRSGPIKEVEMSALESSWEIDARGLSWAFDFLDDEHDLERILAAIPGFYNSGLVKESQRILTAVSERISSAVLQLMDRSLSSDLVQEDVRKRRGAMCLKVLEVQPDLRHATIQQSLHFIGTGVFKWIDLGLLAERDDNFGAKCVTALVTVYTRGSDGRFPSSIMGQLRVSGPYVAQGDDLLFFNLLDFMLWLVLHHRSVSRSDFQVVENVLDALCKFDVAGTSPELQHPFCALWNVFLDFQEHAPQNLAAANLRDFVRLQRTFTRGFVRFLRSPVHPLAGNMAEEFQRFFSQSRSQTSLAPLLRLLLNRIVTVYNALHASSDVAAATLPVPPDAWHEDDPVERSYPRCDHPSHQFANASNPHPVEPSQAADAATDLDSVFSRGFPPSTSQALGAVDPASTQSPTSSFHRHRSLQQAPSSHASHITTPNSLLVSMDGLRLPVTSSPGALLGPDPFSNPSEIATVSTPPPNTLPIGASLVDAVSLTTENSHHGLSSSQGAVDVQPSVTAPIPSPPP